MRKFIGIVLATQLTAAFAAVSGANAQEILEVTWRKVELLPLKGEVSSIVISDPTITDITLEAPGKALVFGKAPGETSLLMLDSNGEVIVNAIVIVMPENARHVSVTSPSATGYSERTWNCYGRCVQVDSPTSAEYKAPTRPAPTAQTQQGAAGAGQVAGGVQNMNQGAAQGASNVGGSSSTMMMAP